MTSALKTLVFVVSLVALVVAGSWMYSRTLRRPEPVPAEATGTPGTPERPEVWVGREVHPDLAAGVEALQDNRLDEARASLERVPEDDPGYLVALENLSRVEIRSGDFAAAAALLERAAALQPDAPKLHASLARVYFELGRYAEAEVPALRAWEANPDEPSTRYELALYRLAAGDVVRAVRTYDRAVEAFPGLEHVSAAVARLRELEAREPDLAGVHYVLAYFARRTNRPQEEIAELETFLESDPEGVLAGVARERLEEARALVGT